MTNAPRDNHSQASTNLDSSISNHRDAPRSNPSTPSMDINEQDNNLQSSARQQQSSRRVFKSWYDHSVGPPGRITNNDSNTTICGTSADGRERSNGSSGCDTNVARRDISSSGRGSGAVGRRCVVDSGYDHSVGPLLRFNSNAFNTPRRSSSADRHRRGTTSSRRGTSAAGRNTYSSRRGAGAVGRDTSSFGHITDAVGQERSASGSNIDFASRRDATTPPPSTRSTSSSFRSMMRPASGVHPDFS